MNLVQIRVKFVSLLVSLCSVSNLFSLNLLNFIQFQKAILFFRRKSESYLRSLTLFQLSADYIFNVSLKPVIVFRDRFASK